MQGFSDPHSHVSSLDCPKETRDGNSRIRVVVRKRPLNNKEPPEDVIAVHSYNYMTLYEPKQRVDTTKYVEKNHYMFDEVPTPRPLLGPEDAFGAARCNLCATHSGQPADEADPR